MKIQIGAIFGKRTVVVYAGANKCRDSMYLCRCVCGEEAIVRGSALSAGESQQCNACAARQTKNRTTHGMSKHPMYTTWTMMVRRCGAPNATGYKDYGGRGIFVCDEWKDHPGAFIEWGVRNGWSPGLTVDRRDPNGPYAPWNCRITTTLGQRENVRLLSSANRSGYRGVSRKHGRAVWLARVSDNGQIVHLGHHATARDAALARDAYVVMAGLKMPLNFLESGAV